MTTDTDVAIDIETTGLSPWEHKVVTVAVVGEHGDRIDVFDEPEDEERLLTRVEEYMRRTRIGTLFGWNHSEFDLPWIAVRFVLNGIDLPPFLRPTGQIGKYGKPRYDGVWYGANFHDIAYDYERFAKDAGVKWSLKPVAKAKKMGPGIEVDFDQRIPEGYVPCTHLIEGWNESTPGTGDRKWQHEFDTVWRKEPFTVLDLTKQQRELYCVSDAQLVLGLAEQLPSIPKGQAVTLNEGFSIL